jgi:MFS family permease
MLVSMIGTWMQSTAQSWLVLTLSSSAIVLGVVNALNFLPSLVLSLFAGVLIDRLSKRRVLLVTQSLGALQAVLLWFLVWRKWIVLREVYALTLLLGIINAFDQPARQAFVTEMVPEEDVTNAIGMSSLLFNAARTAGPMVAGVTIAVAGLAPSFLINAISFIFVVVGFLFMRPGELKVPATPPKGSFGRDLKEGFDFVIRTPLIVALMIALFFAGLFGYNFATIIPLLAKFVVRGGPRAFGVFSSAMGAGSMAGALLISGQARPTKKILYSSAVLFGLSEAAILVSQNYFWVTALLAVMGLTGIVYLVSTNAMLQLASPPHLRTRVISLYVFLLVGITPLGAVFTGYFSDRFGTVPTVFAEGLLSLTGVFLSLAYLRHKKSPAVVTLP